MTGPATRVVTFGAADDFAGDSEEVDITITASQTLVWSATGKVYAADPIALTSAVGTVTLPCTDQAGFVDQDGHAVTSWAYRVDFGGPGGGGRRSAFYAVPGGTATYDLDTAVPLRYV